jgi:hypothetical protein
VTAMDDGAPSWATLVWTARRILAQHREPPADGRLTGRCAQCGPDGCEQVAWAGSVLERLPDGATS